MKKRRAPKKEFMRMALMAEEALKLAVYEAIKDHARTGDPVALWQNGKVVMVPARKVKIKRPRLKYKPK